jgi:hypothetical protein
MKIRLFIMFIIFNVLVLITLPGCKKGIDITGTWVITTSLSGESFTDTYTFVGNKSSGEVLWEGQSLGTYSVNGYNISFLLEYIDADGDYIVESYDGLIEEEDYMSGTIYYTEEGNPRVTGSWFGER